VSVVPDDPTEALRLAADCVAHAAAAALTDTTSLPDEWHRRYGAVQQIINGLGEFAHNSIDAVGRGITVVPGRELYADEPGEPADPHRPLGEWNVRTNAAIFCLGEALGHWDVAHNRIGRLGVRNPEDAPQ